MTDTLQSLPGNAANNKPVVLKGTPHNDVLHGSLEYTTFYGGLGNDTVYADTTFISPTYVENLTLIGDGNTFGFGNNSNNILTCNSGNNRLSGGCGNDTLYGWTVTTF